MAGPYDFLNQLYQRSAEQGLDIQAKQLGQTTGAEKFIEALRNSQADQLKRQQMESLSQNRAGQLQQKALSTMATLAEKAGPYAKDPESFSQHLSEMGSKLLPDVDPEMIKGLAQSFAGGRFQLGQQNADTRRMGAETAKYVATEGTVPLRQAQAGLAEANTGVAGARQENIEAKTPGEQTKSQMMEELLRSQINRNNRAGTATASANVPLAPETLDYLARVAVDDPSKAFSFLGRNTQGRAQLTSRLASQGTNITAAGSEFKSWDNALKENEKLLGLIVPFEKTVQRNLQAYTKAAQLQMDTGIPILNKPLRWLAEKGGSEEQAVANTWRGVHLPEMANLLMNARLVGANTVHAQNEIEKLNPDDATIGQIMAIQKELEVALNNRKEELQSYGQSLREMMKNRKTSTYSPNPPALGAVTPPAPIPNQDKAKYRLKIADAISRHPEAKEALKKKFKEQFGEDY